MKLIPAIDIFEGQCVRLYQGDFERQTNYAEDPGALAEKYRSIGFDLLHVVDLDGAKKGRPHNHDVLQRISSVSGLTIQLGGGIRSEGDVQSRFAAGVHRIVVGSLAVAAPTMVRNWLAHFGPEKIVLALDVNVSPGGTPYVATHGWARSTTLTLWQCIDQYLSSGLRHVLCTDIHRDGAMTGPNTALYTDFVGRYPDILLQASGGIRGSDDLEALQGIGASAAISGRALLDGKITTQEMERFLPAA